jgi:hypothetical protein
MKRRGFLKGLGIGIVAVPLINNLEFTESKEATYHAVYRPSDFDRRILKAVKGEKNQDIGSWDDFSNEELIEMKLI